MTKKHLLLAVTLLAFIGFSYKSFQERKVQKTVETPEVAGLSGEQPLITLTPEEQKYRDNLIVVLDYFYLQFTKVSNYSEMYRTDEFDNVEFVERIEKLNKDISTTQTSIAALGEVPEVMKNGVELYLEGLNKLRVVTQTVIDYDKGVLIEVNDIEQTGLFMEALQNFQDAEELLGIQSDFGEL